MFTIPSIKQKFSQFLEIDKIGFDENNYQSISSRFGKIEASVRVIGHNFWTGTGTGDLQDELIKEYRAMGFLMGYKYKYNPHNQFLDNLARNGIFGVTICLVALYLFPLYYSLKRKALLLTAFISVAALVSLTESILDVHKGITFYTFFLSLIFYSQIYKFNEVK
jgi:O-antigen ligase